MTGSKPRSRIALLYPNLYLWLVFFGSLDIMLTRLILFFSGVEVNPIADWILKSWGIPGISAFKFGVIVFVILVCEFVGRLRARTGKALAIFAVSVTGLPVAWSLSLLTGLLVKGELPPIETAASVRELRMVEYPAPRIADGHDDSEEVRTRWAMHATESESSFWEVALAVPISPES